MVDLLSVWLPILVSAVAVFMASSIAWMVLPHHKPDIKGLPDEDAINGALKSSGVKPGFYMFPFCATGEEMKSEAFQKRYTEGPHGSLTLLPARPNFGRNLGVMFAFNVVVSVCVGYVATLALADTSSFGQVFRLTGTVAIMSYVLGAVPGDVWFGRTPRHMLMNALDGLAYGLITGAIFGWLWPGVA